jgi:hypothetical protein
MDDEERRGAGFAEALAERGAAPGRTGGHPSGR